MPPRFIKKIEHGFKTIVNLPLRICLRKGDSSRVPVDPSYITSILILRPDKLGDMIVTIPVFHALKRTFPKIRVEVIASPRNFGVIKNDPEIDAIHLYRKNIFKDLPLILKLGKKRFDVVYDPICHDSTTGLLLTKSIGKNSIQAAARKLKLNNFYDYCRPYLPEGNDHNIDNGFLIFELFGVDPKSVDPFEPVYLPDSSLEKANQFYSGLPEACDFRIGVNISAGSKTRSLPAEKYARLLNLIGDRYPEAEFIIFSVMPDREKARKLQEGIKTKSFLIPENLSLLDASAIMKRLDLLISPDTSMIHIARLMKIPVVGLYSGHKRNFRFWRPYRQKYGAVVAKNIENIFDITPEQVFDEFEKLMDEIGHPARSDAKAKK